MSFLIISQSAGSHIYTNTIHRNTFLLTQTKLIVDGNLLQQNILPTVCRLEMRLRKKKKKTIEMSQTTVGYVLNTQCIFKLRFEKFFSFFFTVHLVAIVTSVKV